MHRISKLLRCTVPQKHLVSLLIESIEDEWDLQSMASPEFSIEPRRSPGELIHIGSTTTLCMSLSQADCWDTVKPVCDDGREQLASAGIRTYCTIGGKRLSNGESICRYRSCANILVNIIDGAIGYHEQSVLLSVGSEIPLKALCGLQMANCERMALFKASSR